MPVDIEPAHPGVRGARCRHPSAGGVHVNCNDCGDDGLSLRTYLVMEGTDQTAGNVSGARIEMPAEDPLATELEGLAVEALALCHERGWSREWVRAGCYLSLEVSEFVEALRGKRGDPQKEAADILFVLFSTCAGNGVALGGVVARLRELVAGAAVKSLGERGDPAEALERAVERVGLKNVLTRKEQHDLREALLAELRQNVHR